MTEVQSALQEFGLVQSERFVLLTGVVVGARALVRTCWIPRQLPESHAQGLSVTVPGDELQRLNSEWARRQEQLLVQIHSHPALPYHSETDDRYPMVTIEGGLSIVVPLFGFTSLTDFATCAVYRLQSGHWRWVSPIEAAKLIRFG